MKVARNTLLVVRAAHQPGRRNILWVGQDLEAVREMTQKADLRASGRLLQLSLKKPAKTRERKPPVFVTRDPKPPAATDDMPSGTLSKPGIVT